MPKQLEKKHFISLIKHPEYRAGNFTSFFFAALYEENQIGHVLVPVGTTEVDQGEGGRGEQKFPIFSRVLARIVVSMQLQEVAVSYKELESLRI